MPIFKTHIYLYKITIPIRFLDFSFGEMRIYSLGDFFSFIFSLIFGDFLLDLLTKLQGKNDDLVPQSIIFSSGNIIFSHTKYVDMPNFY